MWEYFGHFQIRLQIHHKSILSLIWVIGRSDLLTPLFIAYIPRNANHFGCNRIKLIVFKFLDLNQKIILRHLKGQEMAWKHVDGRRENHVMDKEEKGKQKTCAFLKGKLVVETWI